MTGTKAITDHDIKLNNPDEQQRVNDIYNRIRHTEPLISSDLISLTAKEGANMDGLSFSVKTASSIEDKLARMHRINPKSTPSKDIMQMRDLVRYTEIVKHEDIPDATEKMIKALENKGYVHSGTKNYYANPFRGTEYMGMHLNFISPYGSEIELQVHSKESFAAKQEGHALYEQLRSVSCKQETKEKLQKEIVAIHQSVSKPKGYERIKDFSLNLNDRERLMKEHMSKTAVLIRESENAEVYDVLKNGQKLMHGFEGRFSDGSMVAYQNDYQHHRTRIASLTKDGMEMSDVEAKSLELKPQQVEQIIEHQENVHEDWMKSHFGCVDIDLSIPLKETKQPTKTTDEMER